MIIESSIPNRSLHLPAQAARSEDSVAGGNKAAKENKISDRVLCSRAISRTKRKQLEFFHKVDIKRMRKVKRGV